MTGWDQRGDIDDLARRMRQERRARHWSAIIFCLGGLANIALGVKRHDFIQFAIGLFLLTLYVVNRR